MGFLDDLMRAVDPENIDKAVSNFKGAVTGAVDSVEAGIAKAEATAANLDASGQKVAEIINKANGNVAK